MIIKDVEVNLGQNTERRMAMLVSVAGGYNSKIHISHGDRTVNAKSIMGVMTLMPYSGDVLTIKADGADEEKAANALYEFLTGKKDD